jgi:hypothetical protein
MELQYWMFEVAYRTESFPYVIAHLAEQNGVFWEFYHAACYSVVFNRARFYCSLQ